MDIDTTVTTDINATAGRGQQHSEAKKVELMRSNACFYYEIKGHCAKDCHKKQADCGNFSGHPDNPKEQTLCMGKLTMPDFQNVDSVSGFLKDNMDTLDEDTKLDIIQSLMPKDFYKAQN